MNLPEGGQPAWGTSLGQGEGHKFTYPGFENILVGMVFTKINDIENVWCPLGKGGKKQDDYQMVLAGLFNKIFVNGKKVDNASFVLLLVKQMVASPTSQQHIGRRILKYNNGITYNGDAINENCYRRMAETLGLTDKSAWFVSAFDVKNQDELHFVAYIGDKDKSLDFASIAERKEFCASLAGMEKETNGFNKIYYGCPGCGKSFLVKKTLKEKGVKDDNIFRVTFHPEYSNYDFVGQLIPKATEVVQSDGSVKEEVSYSFNKGPFTLALEKSLQTNEMVYLVIEEINRGNAAAIFGDLFQLLDRVNDKKKSNFGSSEYPITNVNIQKELGIDRVVIPSNLSLIATMNTSDQNVFTLDTAFKRRWEFEHVNNDFDSNHRYANKFLPGANITWKDFVEKVNEKIVKQGINDSISDDKRIGKYFVSEDVLTDSYVPLKDEHGNINAEMVKLAKKFGYKILEYIWNDVAKYDAKAEWFDLSRVSTLEDLISCFIDTTINNPLAVFGDLF